MSLYAIGDLHLSLSTDKPMDVFGGAWDHYVEKIRDGFSSLGPADTTVLCGDLTWGMTLEESLEDFRFVDSLPGKKIILKGNHDYWWTTVSKARSFFLKNGITTIEILNNNSFPVKGADGKTVYVCGTRGWFYEEETGGGRADAAHDRKIMAREIGRLDASLTSATESAPAMRPQRFLPVRHRSNPRQKSVFSIIRRFTGIISARSLSTSC